MAKTKTTKPKENTKAKIQVQQKRKYIKQADVPMSSLDDALRIPQTSLDNYVSKLTSPLYVGIE